MCVFVNSGEISFKNNCEWVRCILYHTGAKIMAQTLIGIKTRQVISVSIKTNN